MSLRIVLLIGLLAGLVAWMWKPTFAFAAKVAAAPVAHPSDRHSGKASASSGGHETPFACVPAAMSAADRKRHFEELGPELRRLHKGVRELPDGYEFLFAADPSTYRSLSEWMFQERACCPFFDLAIRLDRENGPMALVLTGREGVKEFIRSEFPSEWFR